MRVAEHRRRHHEPGDCGCFNPLFQMAFAVDRVFRSDPEWEHVLFSPTICYLVPVIKDMYIYRLGPLLSVDERADILRRVKQVLRGLFAIRAFYLRRLP
jgi:hypothetical protein